MKKLKSIEIARVSIYGGEIAFELTDGTKTTGDDQATLDILLHDLQLLLDRRSSQRQASRDYLLKLQKERERKKADKK